MKSDKYIDEYTKTVLKELGSACKEHRLAKGWSQAQLADATGIKQQYISKFESGLSNCRLVTLFRIFYALDRKLELRIVDKKEAKNGK